MKRSKLALLLGAALLLAGAGCERGSGRLSADAGVRQTGFPGEITAGGGTSGDVMARTARPVTDGSYAGGTPGIAGGSGGTAGGTASGGAVRESGHGPSGATAPPAAKPTPSGQ